MNPLDEVIDWYKSNLSQQKFFMEIVKNSHKMIDNITVNAILMKYELSSSKKDEIKTQVDKIKNELNDLTIVSLWSIFEAFLNDELKKQADNITKNIADPILKNISFYSLKESEKWLKDDVLDLYKVSVDSQLVGDVKEIYNYRNWVAHGKTRNKPFNLEPFIAYQKLTEFLLEAKLIKETL